MNKNKFNKKQVEQLLAKEDKYITNLFSISSLPERQGKLISNIFRYIPVFICISALFSAEEDSGSDGEESNKSNKPIMAPNSKTTRASSLSELQGRLQSLTSKKKLTYKEKLTKKNLKTRMKKKTKRDDRNAQQKLERANKLTLKEEAKEKTVDVKPAKPIFNAEDKIVYSKFDFSNLGAKKSKKQEKDPKKILENLKKQKQEIQELKASGDIVKAVEVKEKTAWKNALAKASGEKVKDDPILLKRTVKRQEQKQKSSKKKWDKRIAGVQKAQEERQKKRTDNIAKKKKDKKVHKLKNAAKRGKIIPGF